MAYPGLPACVHYYYSSICGRPLEPWPPGAVVPLRDGGLRVWCLFPVLCILLIRVEKRKDLLAWGLSREAGLIGGVPT